MFSTVLKKKQPTAQTRQAGYIFLVRGKDSTGEQAWYYVQVDRSLRDRFMRLSGITRLDISEFGTVLHCGYGTQPPQHIRDLMKQEYGFSA